MILLIDNYDSFVHNLARYFARLGQETCVVRNDRIDAPGVLRLEPDAVVLSPGPCRPEVAGCSIELVQRLGSRLPILGVCLGHQAIAVACGAKVIAATRPIHGQSSAMFHDQQGIFQGLPNPFTAGRYHSLIVDESSLPSELKVSAWTEDRVVMGLRHRKFPLVGIQFHPESILTESGYDVLRGFLRLAGLGEDGNPAASYEDERPSKVKKSRSVSATPLTF